MHFSRTATTEAFHIVVGLTHVHPIDWEGEVDSELRWESHFVDCFEVRNYPKFKSGKACANFYLVLQPA